MSSAPPNVFVSITTISSRIEQISGTLRSILNQSYSAFNLSLLVSKEPYLLDRGISEIPRALVELSRADPRLSIGYVRNIGPYRKLLPMLTTGRRSIIVTADDDTIYGPDWLAGLVEAYNRYRCVICYRGHLMSATGGKFDGYRKWMNNKMPLGADLRILPTGKDGILYDTVHFHENVLNWRDAIQVAPTADDLWFKWHTAAVGVPVLALNTDYRTSSFETTIGSDSPSLYSAYNQAGGNDKVVAKLGDYGRANLGVDLSGLVASQW
jgi:hypothetical protein